MGWRRQEVEATLARMERFTIPEIDERVSHRVREKNGERYYLGGRWIKG
jgi:hypothetical protein